MEIKHLKLVKTIAEEGNLANSSSKLFLTQSALSHQLKELELQLDVKLFFRTRNKWKLTSEGIELYKLSKQVLTTISNSFERIEKLKEGSTGTIKVSTECYSFYQGIPSFIIKMNHLYPNIHVDLILEATHKPISKLLTNAIDIALVTSKPEDTNLTAFEILDDEIFAIINKKHSLTNVDYLKPHHFRDIHLIIHSYPLETVSIFEYFLKPNNITPTKTSAIPLTEVALEMVQANLGIMCMPKWALRQLKTSDDLIYKRISKSGLKRKHYLVIRTEDIYKKYIQDFIANFKESFVD